ncbi:MAG: hypothetical protein IJ493_02910 [Clostridia bacterium]|nr:hypothetical protein [Clostridia bacterium]
MKHKPYDDDRSYTLGTVILIAIAVLLIGGVLVWMYSVKLLTLPDFVTELFGIEDGSGENDLPWDTGELSGIVKGGKSEEGVELTFDITYENLRQALLTEPEPEGLSMTVSARWQADEYSRERTVFYWRRGGSVRAELYDDSANIPTTIVLADDERVYFYDSGAGLSRTHLRADGITPENEAGIPSIEALLEVIASFPENEPQTAETLPADGTDGSVSDELSDCQLALLRTEEGNVYYVSFTWADLGLREEYFIALEWRQIISARTIHEGVTIYEYETLSFSTDPADYDQDRLYQVS